jgi:hypothetical protein
MGLQEYIGLCQYARICIKGITLIQASNTKSKTELTTSTCKTPIWSQSTICNQRGHLPTPQRRRGKKSARSSRHITLLCQGSGQHNPPRTQCHCHQTSKSNQENKSNDKTNVRLLRNAGQSSTCIQSKQHDSCSTQ